MDNNWLRVSMGIGGGRYSGIEMMGERSQISPHIAIIYAAFGGFWA
jgi:hypothetical protein